MTLGQEPKQPAGILLVNKPRGRTSFSLVSALRRRLGVKKIGHAGTLDPFATGLVVLLVGRDYTRLSDRFLLADKEYIAQVKLGEETDSYDCDGSTVSTSDIEPSLEEIELALQDFQGDIQQVPPMFSAKKIKGKKLYELAREGKVIERQPCAVTVSTEILSYHYPYLDLRVSCSKGTYVRSIAHDLGKVLGCGAHLSELNRTRSGSFHSKDSLDGESINDPDCDVESHLRDAI